MEDQAREVAASYISSKIGTLNSLKIQQFKKLDKASAKELLTFNRGIERETLRVTDEGLLVNSTHPETFGSKLTHPNITTDFSESQLE